MNNKTKALIKDLELQIDYLIGYAPQGLHWKKEYYFRENLISLTLSNENTPQEIIEKINRLQESLYRLRNKEINDQPYLKSIEADTMYKAKRKVLVNDMGKTSYYIEI